MTYQEPADYYRNRPARRRSEPVEQQVVLAVGKAICWLLTLPWRVFQARSNSGKRRLLSPQAARDLANHWNQVQEKSQTPATRDLAIAEADKLLDMGLKLLNLPGKTMGERLKAAEGLFPEPLYNQIWHAHKLRNRLAHEVGVQVSEHEVRTALTSFQWALRELGVFI